MEKDAYDATIAELQEILRSLEFLYLPEFLVQARRELFHTEEPSLNLEELVALAQHLYAAKERCRRIHELKVSPRSTITVVQAYEMLRLRRRGWSCSRIAKKYGINHQTVRNAIWSLVPEDFSCGWVKYPKEVESQQCLNKDDSH